MWTEDGRMDRRTDMINLVVAFRKFANAPKNIMKTMTSNNIHLNDNN
jgi:hypothetical protein